MADWSKITSRGNVEDRRGAGPMLAIGGGGAGLIGLVLYLVTMFMGGNSTDLNEALNQLQAQAQQQQGGSGEFAGADNYEQFAGAVLGSDNDAWRQIFSQSGKNYREPKLVLFRSATQSGCGVATSDVGPHYCPADETIYLDETFFDVLQQQFKAKGGDVAEAYVIAHEVGHHVQKQLGTMDKVARLRDSDPGSANELSVKTELQADCFAGVWAKAVSKQGVFEPGEINEAIDAAAAVGDDRIQKTVQGHINPETWTHGSSAQRVDWFNRGAASGNPSSCDTF
jgi:predicted metalloprotease